ncbi:hypothetical protein [Leifsonia soli]|uniref:Putative MarR family transcription regulator n=1 Tax=Leifsonia soli TaxID=582665 RepID=A0A852T5G2_9MICO|nr:hypothetical protein [Leifsonia soli]NYD76111.1 putative MarR family transcription regulator [Leifsonia soli]
MDDMTAGIVLAGIFAALTVGAVVATITLGGRTNTVTKLGVLDKAPDRQPQTFSTEKLIDEELSTGLSALESVPYRIATTDTSSSNHAAELQQGREVAQTNSSQESRKQCSDRAASCDGKQPPRRRPT